MFCLRQFTQIAHSPLTIFSLHSCPSFVDDVHRHVLGHARDKKVNKKRIDEDWFNVPESAVVAYLAHCTFCVNNKTRKPRESIVKSIVEKSTFNSRGHVDLIDFTASPSNGYKWVMRYVDSHTKFAWAIPLKDIDHTTVGLELFKIFTIQGGPCVLQINHGSEYTEKVCSAFDNLPSSLPLDNLPSSLPLMIYFSFI
jgi:hypothetical protein